MKIVLVFLVGLVAFFISCLVFSPIIAIMIFGVIIVLGLFISWYTTIQSSKISKFYQEQQQEETEAKLSDIMDKVSKIKIGMAYQDLVGILGKQGQIISENTDNVTYMWSLENTTHNKNAPISIIVSLANDKVISKECKNLF